MIRNDFETRSRSDIEITGAWKYSLCPTTQILCMAYNEGIKGEPTKLWVPPEYRSSWEEVTPRFKEGLNKLLTNAHGRLNKCVLDNKVTYKSLITMYTKDKTQYVEEYNPRLQRKTLKALPLTTMPTEAELLYYLELKKKGIEDEVKAIENYLTILNTKDFWHYDPPKWAIDEDEFQRLGGLIEAHNSSFEQAIWKNVCVPRYGFVDYKIKAWRDSMAKAASHALPLSLGKCAEALQTTIKKDEAGRRSMLDLTSPNQDYNTGFIEITDVPEKYLSTYTYCINDVDTQKEISERLPNLIPAEQNLLILTDTMNQRGIRVDVDTANKCLEHVKIYSTWALKELEKLTQGEVTSISELAKFRKWAEKNGVKLDNAQKAYLETIHDKLDDDHIVKKVIKLRLDLGKSSVSKLETMRDASDPRDDAIRYTLLYHGASTGRYAGRLLQPQNMPSPKGKFADIDMDEAVNDLNTMKTFDLVDKYGDLLGLISSSLRSMIIAPKGHDFVSADYNAIEARVVMWMAGAETAVRMFLEGADLYKDMASLVYKVPVEEVSKPQRQLGKGIILGAGFGMGVPKFRATCEAQGIEITEELATEAIRVYREDKYPEVPNFWKNSYESCKEAVITGHPVEFNMCVAEYDKKRDFLYIRLPSGRSLAYAIPRIKKLPNKFRPDKMENALTFWAADSKTKQWRETGTYGGHLVENIVQAVARDCMVEGMKRVEKAGYKNIFTVHDELVCAAPHGFGSLEEFLQLLETPPSWGVDLPIKAEGWRGYRYRK